MTQGLHSVLLRPLLTEKITALREGANQVGAEFAVERERVVHFHAIGDAPAARTLAVGRAGGPGAARERLDQVVDLGERRHEIPEQGAVCAKPVEGLVAPPIGLVGRQRLAPEFGQGIRRLLVAELDGSGPPEDGPSEMLRDTLAAFVGVPCKELRLRDSAGGRLFHELRRFLIAIRQLQHQSEPVAGVGKVRLQFERAEEVGFGALPLAGALEHADNPFPAARGFGASPVATTPTGSAGNAVTRTSALGMPSLSSPESAS